MPKGLSTSPASLSAARHPSGPSSTNWTWMPNAASEIMWSRLINIAEECWYTVIRTAFSLIIGEAQDFACEILDAAGRQIAHSPRAMPVFNLTLPIAVNAMLEKFPVETLRPGDVLVTNDPWLCAGHLFDIAIAAPVFRHGRVVAIIGIVGHVTDIGGTKNSLNATEILRGGDPDPADEAVPRRAAERGSAGAYPGECAGSGPGHWRHPCAGLGQPHRRRPTAPLHGRIRDGRSRSAGHGRPGPRRAEV